MSSSLSNHEPPATAYELSTKASMKTMYHARFSLTSYFSAHMTENPAEADA